MREILSDAEQARENDGAIDMSFGDSLLFEPEVDDSEPGQPTRPDPDDAGGQAATIDVAYGDSLLFEPEVDDSEPGQPTRPDPGDAGGQPASNGDGVDVIAATGLEPIDQGTAVFEGGDDDLPDLIIWDIDGGM